MMSALIRFQQWTWVVMVVAVGLAVRGAGASEVTVKNDSFVSGQTPFSIQVGFDPGERAAAWLASPCTGTIVAVQVLWLSQSGGTGQSLEDSITIYAGGVFPTPGAQLAVLEGPVMTDGAMNEFRYLDDQQAFPINVPISSGQVFVVSFQFLNDPDPANGPSVATDLFTGCQAGKNGLFANPGIWLNSCSLGVSGDWIIRGVVDCHGACCLPSGSCSSGTSASCASSNGVFQGNGTTCGTVSCPQPTQACCFPPDGCLNLTTTNCALIPGTPQGPGSSCQSVICFPRGACCQANGSCDDDVAEEDCTAGGGTFQGDESLCSGVSCPQPMGACCLSNGNCLVLSQGDCAQIPSSAWAGSPTDCLDADMDGTADVCELLCFDDGDCDDGDACTEDTCTSGACSNTPASRPFGDIAPPGGDGVVDLNDILCVLDGFGAATVCPDGDLVPCGADDGIDLNDILAELDAFANVFACADPCP